MKKLTLICSLALLGLSLSGCGSQDKQKSTSSNKQLYSVELKKTDTNYDSSERMWTLNADKNGKYTLKLKANKDGKITVTSKSDGVYNPNTDLGSIAMHPEQSHCADAYQFPYMF